MTSLSQKIKTIRTISLSIIVVSVICFALTRTCSSAAKNTSYVRKVVDGDTILLTNGEYVRYIGIDTPESRRKNASGRWVNDPKPFAKEATRLNKKLVLGKNVRLEFDVEKRDKYKRLLAYVFVDDIFVNARLIEEGLAQLLTIPPNNKYTALFKKLQKKARKEKRGLWKYTDY